MATLLRLLHKLDKEGIDDHLPWESWEAALSNPAGIDSSWDSRTEWRRGAATETTRGDEQLLLLLYSSFPYCCCFKNNNLPPILAAISPLSSLCLSPLHFPRKKRFHNPARESERAIDRSRNTPTHNHHHHHHHQPRTEEALKPAHKEFAAMGKKPTEKKSLKP